MEHVNFRDLCHRCASIMRGQSLNLDTTSKILGHCSQENNQHYGHQQVDAQRVALGKLGDLVLPPMKKARAAKKATRA